MPSWTAPTWTVSPCSQVGLVEHVAAHLSLNAEALGNLVHWARTGEERPMYSSPGRRTTDIEAGALRPPDDLRAWFDESARKLSATRWTN